MNQNPRNTQYAGRNMRNSFTFIELMIAASILAVGLVFILRSFLSVVGAIETSSNKIKAVDILESRMSEIEQIVGENKYIEPRQDQVEIELEGRPADLSVLVEQLVFEEEITLQEEIEEKVVLEEVINKVALTLTWKEDNRERDQTLATYFISNETKGFEF
jgi:Tfp pilus assembly protein PilE